MSCKKKWNSARESGTRAKPVQVEISKIGLLGQKYQNFRGFAELIVPFSIFWSSNLLEYDFMVFRGLWWFFAVF